MPSYKNKDLHFIISDLWLGRSEVSICKYSTGGQVHMMLNFL